MFWAFSKTDIEGGLPKRERGLGQFADLTGGLARKGGGWYSDAHYDNGLLYHHNPGENIRKRKVSFNFTHFIDTLSSERCTW